MECRWDDLKYLFIWSLLPSHSLSQDVFLAADCYLSDVGKEEPSKQAF